MRGWGAGENPGGGAGAELREPSPPPVPLSDFSHRELAPLKYLALEEKLHKDPRLVEFLSLRLTPGMGPQPKLPEQETTPTGWPLCSLQPAHHDHPLGRPTSLPHHLPAAASAPASQDFPVNKYTFLSFIMFN